MIDVHTHILPGIDDGSKSVEMSLEMLRILASQGVTTVVATPHFYATRNNPESFYEDRQRAREQLGQLPEDLPLDVFHFHNGFDDAVHIRNRLGKIPFHGKALLHSGDLLFNKSSGQFGRGDTFHRFRTHFRHK